MASHVDSIAERIAIATKAFGSKENGSRESLISLGQELVAALEIPSEFIQRTLWAEPALSASCRMAVDIQLFQHLKNAGTTGLTADMLVEKTGLDTILLKRIMRHLAAEHVVSCDSERNFHATPLSNGLAEQNYQDSISFCYDVSRPSFNGFPEHFKRTGYKKPISLPNGPFQAAHKSNLPFFEWLVATPPHLSHFDSFMSAYRAGKANWFDEGFYPVAERLSAGFDPSNSEVLLVDVGGGRGHDIFQFAKQHTSHPGKLLLQDREPVITSIERFKEPLPYEAQAYDFFKPQPTKAARAYLFHSIFHSWDDNDCVRILENLKSALKPGYSRVLINEIVVSEKNPSLASTTMDMMMLAHFADFAVRERTELEWKGILSRAGLRFCKIYSYPGVAESVIEAELAWNLEEFKLPGESPSKSVSMVA